jgi:hypothetical protein
MRAMGVALMTALAITSGVILLLPSRTVPLLVAAHTLSYNQQISSSDLRVEYVEESFPATGFATDRNSLIGHYAVTKIPAGNAIAASQTTATAPLPRGTSIVSVPLASSTVGLREGQKVTLVPSSKGTDGTPQSFSVTVVSLPRQASTGFSDEQSIILVGASASDSQLLVSAAQRAPMLAANTTD